ncbi:MAG: hypothetical protein NZ769_08215 [Anaerolineae bacterium]|nr:hypothetical protein [Anaerolineae bacterium]
MRTAAAALQAAALSLESLVVNDSPMERALKVPDKQGRFSVLSRL